MIAPATSATDAAAAAGAVAAVAAAAGSPVAAVAAAGSPVATGAAAGSPVAAVAAAGSPSSSAGVEGRVIVQPRRRKAGQDCFEADATVVLTKEVLEKYWSMPLSTAGKCNNKNFTPLTLFNADREHFEAPS